MILGAIPWSRSVQFAVSEAEVTTMAEFESL